MNSKLRRMTPRPRRAALYPMFMKLEDRRVLVVGGGKVAEEKLEGLLHSTSGITVIAPRTTPRIAEWTRQGLLRRQAGEYREGDALGYFLVVACTDSQEVNRKIFEECRQAGILCNVVDDPSYCDFYASAVVRRGDLQIAISTGGSSPALAQRIRKRLESDFGPEYEAWNDWLGRMRTILRRALPRDQHTRELLHVLAACGPEKFVDQPRNTEVESMSQEFTQSELAGRIREVLKEHQREGLNMIGSVDKLVSRLVHAVHNWIDEGHPQEKKSA